MDQIIMNYCSLLKCVAPVGNQSYSCLINMIKNDKMTDQNIITEILLGNRFLFSKLIDKYQRMVFTLAMGFVHQKENAEDLTQDIFIKVWIALPNYKGDAIFSTWLYRIAVNYCVNFVEKNKRNRFIVLAEELIGHVFNTAINDKDAQQELEEMESGNLVRTAIDSLPINQRTAFILSAYEELPIKEIAAIMNRSEGAVEQLLLRAKMNLKKKIKHP